MKFNIKSGHKGFLVILFIGVALLVAAVIHQVVMNKINNEWTRAEAKVAAYKRDFVKNSDGETELVYKAVLSWTVDGVEYRGESADYFHYNPPIIGASYRIAYNPENPQDMVEIDNGILVEIILYAIGAILSCAGIGFFLKSCIKRSDSV